MLINLNEKIDLFKETFYTKKPRVLTFRGPLDKNNMSFETFKKLYGHDGDYASE
jgi:hypothetical protein